MQRATLAVALAFGCARAPSANRSSPLHADHDEHERRTTNTLLPAQDAAHREAGPTLPPPYHTPSADNPARLVPRPASASLRVPPGYRIAAFATATGTVRWIATAPDGSIFGADGTRGEIVVFRDSDGDGVAETRATFASGLEMPFGLAFHPAGWLYVANTSSIVRFRHRPGQTAASGPPERIAELPGHGYHQHWTRNIVVSPDAQSVWVSVGSETNADVESDPRRAAISSCDLTGGHHRIVANGIRNPIGLAFHPVTHAPWTVVNERDELGDDLVPDYLTRVQEGAFYGWPYAYFGAHEDPRHRGERPDLVARTVVPDLSLGAHVAPIGLVFYDAAMFPADVRGDAFVALHGSWNRSRRVGYRVVRVRFRDGVPTREIDDFVTGWQLEHDDVWGRPAGLAVASDGALLVVDDAGAVIWRVSLANGPGGTSRIRP